MEVIRITCFKFYGLVFNIPVDPVFAEAGINIHLNSAVVTTENTCEFSIIGCGGTVKNAVSPRMVSRLYDWVL